MRRDIQEALLSVREVAVFAWSLLELILTRILPLAGFVAGHLLLQFGRLLAAVVIPAAGRPEHRAAYSSDVLQAEEVIEEDNVLLQNDGDDENDLESLESSGNLEEILTQDEAATAAAEPKIHVAESVPSDEDLGESGAPANEVQVRGSDVAESDSPANDVNVAQCDAPANEVEVRGNVDGHVAETEPYVADGEQGQVSSKGEGSAGKMDLEPSAVQEVTRRRMRLLPPSLSQIKRTLMQRSRRASASPHNMTPSPSPIHKKKPLRKLTIKPASSPDNFMGKFRKHFLLDSA